MTSTFRLLDRCGLPTRHYARFDRLDHPGWKAGITLSVGAIGYPAGLWVGANEVLQRSSVLSTKVYFSVLNIGAMSALHLIPVEEDTGDA